MAEIITKQELIDAQKDAQTLEDVINGPSGELIKTRLGREVYTLASVPQINTMTREEVTAAVALKANQADVDASLTAIAGGHKAYTTLALAQAAQSSLPANTAIEVTNDGANNGTYQWNGATLTKSAYDPLTQAKAYVSNTGMASVVGLALSNINYVTATRTLEFKNTLFIVSETSRYQLTTPQSVALPENTPYRIEYNVSTGLIAAVAYNQTRTEGSLVVGFSTASATTLKTLDFGFTVDGLEVYANEQGELINQVASRINFNNTDKKLVLNTAVRIKSPTYTATADKTIEVPYPVDGPYKLTINRVDKLFSFVSVSAMLSAVNNIELATVTFVGGVATFVDGISNYTLNGKEFVSALGSNSEYGELYNTVPSRISFDTTAKTLTITAAVRVLSAGFTYIPPSTIVVPFPTTAGAYSLVFNKFTNMYSFKTRSNVAEKNDIVLSYVDFAATTFFPTVRRIESYVIDGVALGKYSDLKVIYTGELIAASGALNFDFRNSKIKVAPLRLSSSGTTLIPPSQDIEITGLAQTWKKLIYNIGTGIFSVKEITNVSLDGMQDIIVAYFNSSLKIVHGVANYSINGKEVKGFHEPIQNANFRIPYGNVTSTYSGRKLPELNTLYTSIEVNLNAFYALYDDLTTAYPTYVKKTTLGSDKDGNPIHQYQFNAPDVPTVAATSMKPKIIIMSNIHGWEKACTYVLYQSLKEICEQWQNNESLEALRWGANIIVVPVINPSGFISLDRKNSNGVDLERNFPTGWVQGLPADETYGGVAPLSEPEAVIIDNLLANNTDAIQFMSCHSFSGMTPAAFPNGVWTWLPLTTDFGINLAKSLIMKNSIQSKKLYPFINVDYVGYADKGAPPGASSYHATHYYGVQGGTFEICGKMYWEPGQPFLSEAVVTCGSNLIINWLLMNIKYATELYNSRVNI